jgi:nitric oxide synthase oxygenase domain/subunit
MSVARRSAEATGWKALGSQPNVLNQLYHYGDRAAGHHEPNEALAAEIPHARLVRLDRVGHRLPAHAVPVVADELLAHTAD